MPCHCGDYCQFMRLAGQEDFDNLAQGGKGKELFSETLPLDLKNMTDIDAIWDSLKTGSIISGSAEEDNWGTMAYIFKCLTCAAITTIWDCDVLVLDELPRFGQVE